MTAIAAEARAGKVATDHAGSMKYQMAPSRVAFRYLITAWSPTDVRDEHEVLGAVLATLLPMRVMPETYLNGSLGEVKPAPDFRVAMSDMWLSCPSVMRYPDINSLQ